MSTMGAYVNHLRKRVVLPGGWAIWCCCCGCGTPWGGCGTPWIIPGAGDGFHCCSWPPLVPGGPEAPGGGGGIIGGLGLVA